MTTLQEQARALGDPTRYRIFRHLSDCSRPASVAEITDHIGIHHNAIRQHLTKLVDARLVVESTAKTGTVGRPKLVYHVHPGVGSRWEVVGPYERLSMLLLEVARTGDTPVTVGRRVGAAAAADAGESALDALVSLLTEQGFAPTADATPDGDVEIRLGHCPYAMAASESDIVCALHRGMAEGLAATIGGLAVVDLERRDPHEGGCVLRCRTDTSSETTDPTSA